MLILLSIVQSNLRRRSTQDYYQDLREHLAYHTESWPDPGKLRLLGDTKMRIDPGNNWLAVPYYMIGRNV